MVSRGSRRSRALGPGRTRGYRMPCRSAKTRRPAAGASSSETPRRTSPRGANFSYRATSSGSSLALAGLHAAQRLRRSSFP